MQNRGYGFLTLYKNCHPVAPNIYVYDWESDLIGVVKSGYVHEIEIKISKSDFKADAKKKEKHEVLQTGSHEIKNVRSWLVDHWRSQGRITDDGRMIARRPNYFWYGCPEGLIEAEDVPPYSGLVHLGTGNYPKVLKPPKLLHKNHIIPLEMDSIMRSMSFKYWQVRLKETQENEEDRRILDYLLEDEWVI